MPITYRIDPEAKIVFVVVEGNVTLREMVSTVTDVAHNPGFRRGFQILSDHRKITASATTEEVKAFVLHTKQYENILAHTEWAIVVSSDLSFGMMRMLSALAETIPMRVEVFRDYNEAMGWLHKDGSDGPAT